MTTPTPIVGNVTKELSVEGVTHTSFSRLNEMTRCSWKYMLKYELGIRAPQNLNMARGSAGHFALEQNARHKISTGSDMPTSDVIDLFAGSFATEISEIEDFEGINPDKVKDDTVESVRLYMLKYAKDVTPLSVELEFLIPIPQEAEHHEPVPPIKGYIDIINRRQRSIYAHAPKIERTELLDRKFPGRKPSNSQDRAAMSDQLNIYDYVLTSAGTPTDDIGFEFHIPPTKTIPSRIEYAYRLPADMTYNARAVRQARTLFKMRQMQRIIKAGHYIPVDDPRVCSGCELRKMCQYSLAKDDYTAEKFTRESFQP